MPTWGRRYTWNSGFAIELATPVACEPSSSASVQNVERALKVKFTIINGTSKPYEAAALSFGNDVQFSGAKAEAVFDPMGACGGGGLDAATVLPGKTYTYERAYVVGCCPNFRMADFFTVTDEGRIARMIAYQAG